MSSSKLRRGRISLIGHTYVLTTVCCGRRPWFDDPASAAIVMNALHDLSDRGYVSSLAWVVMPDHVHWMFELCNEPLCNVARRFKSSTGLALNRMHRRGGAFWQSGYHDHALRSDRSLRDHVMYILGNPVRAGITGKLGEYPHAWCKWPLDP
ncbi:transposase [Stenotrophomonas sp.]|uniref:REP-associated tyrosine transposase n=1 Tax=Stenotrophomonas sp. TaxID=69392 RepID=UPI00289BEEAE|nr:transposase [Stenotrophomonas sp.]